MKSIIYMGVMLLFLSGCTGLNKQVNQIKALEDCKYEVDSIDSVYVANVNMKDLIGKERIDMTKMPRLALALLRQNVPLRGRLNLTIRNPSSQLAAINQFEYKVLVKDRELAGGFVNRNIAVSPHGGSVTVPIQINSNIYHVLSDDRAMDAIADFLIGAEEGSPEKMGVVTIKIRPTLDFGNKQIKYPGYITIDKEISSKKLFK